MGLVRAPSCWQSSTSMVIVAGYGWIRSQGIRCPLETHLSPSGCGPRPLAVSVSQMLAKYSQRFNSEADHAANAALDADMDWERVSEVPQADRWRLSVDGAYRRGAKAAAGVVLHCYNGEGDKQTVARYGFLLVGVTSSLVAELAALELGLEKFAEVVKKKSAQDRRCGSA